MGRKREGNGMVKVRVLGAVELQIGHRRIGMNTEVLFALALVLTTRAGQRIPRDELLELLWAKGSADLRRHALRQMLYRLRQKGLELEEDGDKVMVAAARVDSDLRAALDPAWVDAATAEQVDAAASFGPTFSRRMAPGFVAWVDELREQLSHQHRKASLRQINVARREARWADLERWAQSVLKSDPLNEEATMARAESAAMAGSKTMAIEILDTYLAEVQPISPELGKPALALRKRLAERRADWTLRGPKEVALVGREEVMSRLTGLVEAAWKGEGSSVVLVGAPGIGKTRLAREVQGYAELKGMRTIHVGSDASNRERPLSLILAVAQATLQLPGAAGSSPESLQLLRRLTEAQPFEREAALRSQDLARESLVAALDDALAAVAHECRIVIVLEDLHIIDEFSWSILPALWSRLSRTRILWLSTSRRLLSRVEITGSSITEQEWSHLTLFPLDDDASRHLASLVLTAHRLKLSPESFDQLLSYSAGNPLFIRELAAYRATTGRLDGVPPDLATVIHDRIGRLSPFAIRILRVVELLGTSADLSLTRALSGGLDAEFEASVSLLEEAGILSIDARGLRMHDLWADAVRHSVGRATRAALAASCARALSGDEPKMLSIEATWRCAALFDIAQLRREAVYFRLLGAEKLLDSGLPDEALSVLLDCSKQAQSPSERAKANSLLSEAALATGRVDITLDATSDVSQWPSRTSDPELADNTVKAICHRADALVKSGSDAAREVRLLLQRAKLTPLSSSTLQLACYTGLRHALHLRELEVAEDFVQLSRRDPEGSGSSATGLLVRLIHSAEFGSVYDVMEADRALDTADLAGLRASLSCSILRFRCTALRYVGELERAQTLGEESYHQALRLRQKETAMNAAEILAFLSLDKNSPEEAARWIARCREMSSGIAHPMRRRTLAHAEMRLAFQLGDMAAVIAASKALPADATTSGTTSQLASEQLMLEIARACVLESSATTREILHQWQQRLSAHVPGFLLDFPAEILSRGLRDHVSREEGTNFAMSYASRRECHFNRPLAPFFTTLSAAALVIAEARSALDRTLTQ